VIYMLLQQQALHLHTSRHYNFPVPLHTLLPHSLICSNTTCNTVCLLLLTVTNPRLRLPCG
jgi:hypothetical protein